MDYNQNNQTNNYYTNPNNYQPQQRPAPKKKNAFSIASLVCGIISIVVCCCGFLSLPMGALSVLFALLARRQGKAMDGMCIAGIVTSVVGMIGGIIFLIFTFGSTYATMNDPAYRDELYDTMEEMYGEEMTDYIFEFYGWD